MFSTPIRTLLLPIYLMGLAALLGSIPSCCDRDKGTSDYDYYDYEYDDDTEDSAPPETVPAARDDVDDCVFTAVVEDRGTAMLDSATVSASSGPAPNGVQLSKEGGDVAISGTVLRSSDEPGWSATFSATTLTGTPNPPIGTEIELDGTWVITLTVDDSMTCADIATPLDLKLVTED
ncbi:MAG: hypothetical protein ACYTEP_04200 [Planctomycetota bacterium]|jgi:hypothetical protein